MADTQTFDEALTALNERKLAYVEKDARAKDERRALEREAVEIAETERALVGAFWDQLNRAGKETLRDLVAKDPSLNVKRGMEEIA